jgi:hypothetical protein
MTWLLLLAASPAEAGCRGSIGAMQRSWERLAVLVSAGAGVDELRETAGVLAKHGGVWERLQQSKPKLSRAYLPGVLNDAEDWLDANPDSLGAEDVRQSIALVRSSCALP